MHFDFCDFPKKYFTTNFFNELKHVPTDMRTEYGSK